MKARQYSSLRCPFCENSFVAIDAIKYWTDLNQDVRYGVIRCDCDSFPIIEGIVVLRRGLTSCVKELEVAFEHKKTPNSKIFLSELSELRLLPRRVLEFLVFLTTIFTFFDKKFQNKFGERWWKFGLTVLTLTTTNSFLKKVFSYFRDRDRRPTYVLVASLFDMVSKSKCVVEIGGGAGHLIRDVAGRGWDGTVFTVEKNFWLTYWLACCGRWSSNTCPIVADVEALLPFNSTIADVVMANDTLMYIDHQKKLANEISRVCKPDGSFFGMHIHQFGQENVANGIGMRPKQLCSWLGMKYMAIWNDQDLFSTLWSKQKITIEAKTSETQLPVNSPSFSIVASRKRTRFKLVLRSEYQRNQLQYVEDHWQN